ncbi:actin binding domain-containing protein [Oopsacas minuta]|uniref:Actin binding domain-containing protein n=1 Tax=Oopsacas minuta TaxID=111878 RepID=A0AAV7KCU7_9METZ|nr:actin binding domain-containing protein [Oopsacas minuta]
MTDNVLRSPKNPGSNPRARSPFRNSVQEIFDYQDYQDVTKVGSPYDPRSQSPTASSGASSPRNLKTNEGYEQSRMEVAALHEELQKKTFTRWMNSHLNKVNQRVNNIYEDLATGERLAMLVTLLTDEPIKLPEKGHMRFHNVNNLNFVLDFIKSRKIKLVGIGAEDIIDGKKNLILGLIWTIILHFQISMITQSDKDPKKEIIEWAKNATEGYYDVSINDLTTSWTDGIAFSALIHRHRPDLIDINRLDKNNPIENLHYAFQVAQEELYVMSLLEPEDMAKGVFDEKCTMTYLSMLKQALPPLPEGTSWSEKDQLKQRFEEVNKWIQEKRILLARKEVPTNTEDCRREINVVNRTSKDCKMKENEVISIQRFEEKIKMMTGADKNATADLDIEGLLEQIHLIEELSLERSAELSKLIGILEHIEELAQKAKLKLQKISSELKALNTEVLSLQNEYSSTNDSKKLEKLNKRKQAANEKAEANRTALNETEIILQSLPAIECKAISDVKQSYSIECENLNQIYKSLAELQPELPDIDGLIEWIRLNTERIKRGQFYNNVTEVRQTISAHTVLHEEIEQFSQQVSGCQRVASSLQGAVAESFSLKLHTLQSSYTNLKMISKKRAEDLRILEEVLESIRDIHDQMEVLEVREKIRKWNPLPNPQTLENELKVLDNSIRELNPKITKLQSSFSTLTQHPAYNDIIILEAQTVEKRQHWVASLQLALETHIRDYGVYRELNMKVEEYESELSKAENTLLQYGAEIDSYSVNCITVLNQVLIKCEQELAVSLNELEDLAIHAPPYHLRNSPISKKILGYLIVKAYEIGIEAGSEVTITSMEMNENWEVELSDGEPTIITSAVIQMYPENDVTTPQRLKKLRERHNHLRDVLKEKLGLVESVGELIRQVEASADAVSSWDKMSLIGDNKQVKTQAYMDFKTHSEELLAKLPGDALIKDKIIDKIGQARSHWSTLKDEAANEELKNRLIDLEAWCRYWQQNLSEQAPLGITLERAFEQIRWEAHMQTQFPEKFEELLQIMEDVKTHAELQPLASSVETQLNKLQDNCNNWGGALITLKLGFDKLGEAWDWLLQLEEQLLKMSDKAMTADTQGQENLEILRQSVLDFINTTIPQHEPGLKATLSALADISEQLEGAGGSPAIKMGAQALRHRWDLLLTEATRLDQGLGGLTKLVALLPRLADELGQWIDEEDLEIANRDRCELDINSLTKLIKNEDRFHKGILMKTPDFEDYSKSAQIHDQIILTITQSHQSYARTLSNARPNLCYNTEADPNATHRFQEDADKLLGQWDDLLSLSEKSLEYKQGTLAALDNVMKLFHPINEFLEEGESILTDKPRAFELEIWLSTAEEFMRKKSSYEPAAGTFIEECESLIASSDVSLVDTHPLVELLEDFKQRWNKLQLSLTEKQQDCKDQIEKLRDEKTQIEALCRDLQSHITMVADMGVILQGISLPAANQAILDKQKTTIEKSDAELKEEERKSRELLHKLGDVSANINTELDQTEMATQVQELETTLQALRQTFIASKTRILDQDIVVQPFEPQLNMLLALYSETKAEFQARPAPSLDSDIIRQEIEFNNVLKEKLTGKVQILKETLEIGMGIISKANTEQLQDLSKSEFSLDPQIADSYEELKQKLSSLEIEWGEFSEALQQNEQVLADKVQLAQEGSDEIGQLLKRILTLKSQIENKGPPGAVPTIVEEQLIDMQQVETIVSEIESSIKALKHKLQINASSPGGIAEQLARLEHEQSSLNDVSSEYNDKLKEGLTLATKYADTHKDLMCWLQDKVEVMSKWEPLGLDTQLLEIQQQSLKSFKEILSSRVEEKQKQEAVSSQCSAELRPSHETTTQQCVELFELWNQLEGRIQQRETRLEKMQVLAQLFEEQVKVTTAKLVEISAGISAFKPNIPIEIQAIKTEITQVTAIKDKLDSMTSEEMVHLSDTIVQITTLAATGEFTDQIQTVAVERDNLETDKTSLHAIITDRLAQLQTTSGLAAQIKTEEDAISTWVKTADKSLDTDFTVRGVSEACAQELSKINIFHESLEEMQTRVGNLEQLNIELSKFAIESDKAKLDKSIVSVKGKVESVVNKEENVTANLQDAQMEAQSFESMCSDLDAYIDQATIKLSELSTAFKSGDLNTLEVLLESVKVLLMEIVNKQMDMDKISEKGADLEKKCPTDGDTISTNVANLQVKYGDLQTDMETLQREMDEAYLRAGELRKATENLINFLKEADKELDTSPPLEANVEFIEQALSKHRALATHLATKSPTITSVLQTLPSLNMTAEAEELQTLVVQVKSKVAARGERIMRALGDLKQFDVRENQLRENLEAFMDQLDNSENCYGVITVVEGISIKHEALVSHLPEMEQMLDEMKEISLSIRTGNLIDDQTIIEDQLGEISQLWEVFSTRAKQQSDEIYNASKTAQRLASLDIQLLNWLEPTYNEIIKNTELTPNNLETVNKKISDMESGLEQHKPQFEEFIQLFQQIEPRAHESGLEDLNEIKTSITQFWTQVESLIHSRRQELEAASKGIEEIMNKLVKIAYWTDTATLEMERISGEPIPSSTDDLERIEDMIVEHDKFMEELGEWHKELEPVIPPLRRQGSKSGSVSSGTETKFNDFIFIAEFSEQIGPTPVLCIPDCCPQNFNQIAFAVRVLSVDWHVKVSNNSGEPLSRFSLDQDVQMLLSEPMENAEAIVNYMTVYDLHARGNERPYCICYISQDKNKILLFFEEIVKALAKIVTHIHRRNYEVFLKDLKVHSNLLRKDLQIIQTEGLPKSLPPGITPESAVEDITSHLEDMSSLMEDLDEMLCKYNTGMVTSSPGHSSILRSHSDTMTKKTGRFTKRVNSDLNYSHSISPSTLLGSPTYTLSTITSSVRNFDRKLRSLPELVSGEMWGEIRRLLEDVAHMYRQDTSVLLLNRYDTMCLKPKSSLLTIGQFAVNNFVPQERSLYQSRQKTVKGTEKAEDNTNLKPEHSNKVWSVRNSTYTTGPLLFPEKKEDETLRTKGSFSPKSFSSLESGDGQSQPPLHSSSTSSGSPNLFNTKHSRKEAERMVSNLEPVGIKVASQEQVLNVNPLGYNLLRDHNAFDYNSKIMSFEGSDSIEGSDGYLTPPDLLSTTTFDIPNLLPNSPILFTNSKLKLKSNSHGNSDLMAQLYRTPNFIHVAYSMLSGKPVMCECLNSCEMEIEELTRNSSLFLPGSANRNMILTTTDQTSLQLSNLHNIKMAMVQSKTLQNTKPYNQIRRHSQLFAINEGKSTFHGHSYDGKLLSMLSKSYITRQRTIPLNDEFILSLMQSALLNLAMKAYLLFYYSLSVRQNVIKSGDILKKSLSMSNSDWEIINYLTKIIREQLIDYDEREQTCKLLRIMDCVQSNKPQQEGPILTLLGYVDSHNEETSLIFSASDSAKK